MLNNVFIIGAIAIFIVVLIIIILVISKGKKKNSEQEASILDVNEVGVPNKSELKDFSYGYEKEETIVMEPVVDEKNKTEENNDKNE